MRLRLGLLAMFVLIAGCHEPLDQPNDKVKVIVEGRANRSSTYSIDPALTLAKHRKVKYVTVTPGERSPQGADPFFHEAWDFSVNVYLGRGPFKEYVGTSYATRAGAWNFKIAEPFHKEWTSIKLERKITARENDQKKKADALKNVPLAEIIRLMNPAQTKLDFVDQFALDAAAENPEVAWFVYHGSRENVYRVIPSDPKRQKQDRKLEIQFIWRGSNNPKNWRRVATVIHMPNGNAAAVIEPSLI